MTAFVPTNIPSNVNTLEELHAWSGMALAEINPSLTVQTSAGAVERAIQAQTFEFRNQSTNPERLIIVSYMNLLPTWRGAGKLYSSGIAEFSTTALPASFTVN
jgi:hypothetical protein